MSAPSLLRTITAYRKALARFNADTRTDITNEEMDALAESTFRHIERTLVAWTLPSATYGDAVAALELATDELEVFEDSELVAPMVKAALAYLKQPEQQYRLNMTHCPRRDCPHMNQKKAA